MTNKTIFILIIATVFLFSCDPIFRAEIKNDSKYETVLKIKFDTIELHKYWGGRTYIPYLKSYPGHTDINHLDFDTINLIKTFIIKPNTTFPIETGTSKPDLALFKTIMLINKDTLKLETKKEMYDSFKRVDNLLWMLIIK